MRRKRYYYLFEIQFLGFRFSGWQKQTNGKTLQHMVEKSLLFSLGHEDFKILAAGRTDRMVSANQFAFELFIYEEQNMPELLEKLNGNLPPDIRALNVKEVDNKFNIIQNSKIKEYIYMFSSGEKLHPFCSPFMVNMTEELDIELMKKGAKLFQGFHNFKHYCCKPSEKTIFERDMILSEIVENNLYTANFFPEKSYIFRVQSSGFLRYQVRLMMGHLFELGKGTIQIEEIEKALQSTDNTSMETIAPASGLMLHSIDFQL